MKGNWRCTRVERSIRVNDWRPAIFLLGTSAGQTSSKVDSWMLEKRGWLVHSGGWECLYLLVMGCLNDQFPRIGLCRPPQSLTRQDLGGYWRDVVDAQSALLCSLDGRLLVGIWSPTEAVKHRAVPIDFVAYFSPLILLSEYRLLSIELQLLVSYSGLTKLRRNFIYSLIANTHVE